MKSRRLASSHIAALKLPSDYAETLANLKTRIKQTQLKAAISANRELIFLYFEIGRQLVEREKRSGWGDKIVERLGYDLRAAFPEMKGFSRANMFYMRQVYLTWMNANKIVQQLVGQIPWGHHLVLVSKVQDSKARQWYLQQSVAHGWSRAVLTVQIESRLFERQGKASSNFKKTLMPSQSDLAQQTLKDPYVFDFLTLAQDAREQELEQGLMDHLQKFLLELGVGFAFVGRQVRLEIHEKEFLIDLLFYHARLKCYIVIELKTESFKPEYAGKMNFYLSAVDDLIRQPDDKPTIGLLLCKFRDKFIVEYALRDIHKPLGVAEWQTRIAHSLPKEFKGTLPTIQEIEKELLDLKK